MEDLRLATADDYARYTGECMFQSWIGPVDGPCIKITREDPMIQIAGEFLRELIANGSPHASLVDGRIMKIHAQNTTVVYRLDAYDPDRNRYFASWPD